MIEMCAKCGADCDAHVGFYELTRQPGGARAGQFWRFCNLDCLERFVRGVT